MDLIQYLQILRRWWWMLVLGAVLFGGLAYIYLQSQEPVYQAQVSVFIGGFIQNPDPDSSEISAGADLAYTYANLVTVRPILESTIQGLDLDLEPDDLERQISTRIVPDTSILQITVTDTSRILAANIANQLAEELINNSPTGLTPEEENRRVLIEAEIETLFAQIDAWRTELEVLETEGTFNPQRSELLGQISEARESIIDLSNTLSAISTQTNNLSVVEPALAPTLPIAQGIRRNTVLAAIVGMMLAMGTAVVFEYLDDTIRAADELQAIVSLPVLAVISRLGSRKDTYQEKLVMRTAPTSSPAEGYRTLRTNLLYGLDFEANTRLVITSARAKEGKSTTASNLAMALARAEHKTVLIDADFYRPQIHQIFELENTFGFSNLFKSQIRRDENLTVDALRHFMQPTDLENLRIITSGQTPSNPAELLGFPHAQSLCRSLEEHFGVTMIIFDTPPVLSVVDPVNLAQNVNASVLLVVMANSTRRADTMRVIERLEQVGTKVAGTVLNNVKRQAEGYYYYGYAPRPKPRKSI